VCFGVAGLGAHGVLRCCLAGSTRCALVPARVSWRAVRSRRAIVRVARLAVTVTGAHLSSSCAWVTVLAVLRAHEEVRCRFSTVNPRLCAAWSRQAGLCVGPGCRWAGHRTRRPLAGALRIAATTPTTTSPDRISRCRARAGVRQRGLRGADTELRCGRRANSAGMWATKVPDAVRGDGCLLAERAAGARVILLDRAARAKDVAARAKDVARRGRRTCSLWRRGERWSSRMPSASFRRPGWCACRSWCGSPGGWRSPMRGYG
jgi:hypothetical protein